ncbi:fibro-slime domain-containing protein [Phycisphaeraceae bacterium D3-23]
MKRNKLLMALAGGLLAFPLGASADDGEDESIVLTGVVRDFLQSHPDMQNPSKSFGVRTGLVLDTLGDDGRPVLNTGTDYTRGMITGPESFNQWFRDEPGVNVSFPFAITLEPHPDKPDVFYYAREKQMSGDMRYFFPADGRGFGDSQSVSTGTHNFYFTYELQMSFFYSDPAKRDYDLMFEFTGDDDVWVFINGQLAVDIGGVHGQAQRSVNLDDEAEDLGLEAGGTYELVLFFAERHTTESNFRIETTLQLEEIPPTTTSPLYD